MSQIHSSVSNGQKSGKQSARAGNNATSKNGNRKVSVLPNAFAAGGKSVSTVEVCRQLRRATNSKAPVYAKRIHGEIIFTSRGRLVAYHTGGRIILAESASIFRPSIRKSVTRPRRLENRTELAINGLNYTVAEICHQAKASSGITKHIHAEKTKDGIIIKSGRDIVAMVFDGGMVDKDGQDYFPNARRSVQALKCENTANRWLDAGTDDANMDGMDCLEDAKSRVDVGSAILLNIHRDSLYLCQLNMDGTTSTAVIREVCLAEFLNNRSTEAVQKKAIPSSDEVRFAIHDSRFVPIPAPRSIPKHVKYIAPTRIAEPFHEKVPECTIASAAFMSVDFVKSFGDVISDARRENIADFTRHLDRAHACKHTHRDHSNLADSYEVSPKPRKRRKSGMGRTDIAKSDVMWKVSDPPRSRKYRLLNEMTSCHSSHFGANKNMRAFRSHNILTTARPKNDRMKQVTDSSNSSSQHRDISKSDNIFGNYLPAQVARKLTLCERYIKSGRMDMERTVDEDAYGDVDDREHVRNALRSADMRFLETFIHVLESTNHRTVELLLARIVLASKKESPSC